MSVAYNPDLAVDRLTQDLLALFAEAGATEPERALSAFAQRRDGVTVTVFAFGVEGDKIKHIWAVRNPDKLRPWTTA